VKSLLLWKIHLKLKVLYWTLSTFIMERYFVWFKSGYRTRYNIFLPNGNYMYRNIENDDADGFCRAMIEALRISRKIKRAKQRRYRELLP
jgi:hypothetical protein